VADRTELVGRRLKLRDLQLFEAVVRWGSIAKAANQLNLTQSAASKAVSQLEHAVGARLLDRNTRGVEPTQYGRALLRRGLAIFDELRQGIKEIEFLADPTIGHVRVGSPESGAAGVLPAIIQELGRKSPGIVCEAVWMPAMMSVQVRELRERRVDLILARVNEPEIDDDLCADILFPDRILIVAGHRNKWLRRRRIQLSELINEPWILTPPDTVSSLVIAEAFRSKGLKMPPASVVSTSIHIVNRLLPSGRYLTYVPESVLRFGSMSTKIRALPVDFPTQARPTAIVTLRDRTLNPAASIFVEAAHFVAKLMAVAK
jgi:DNA-binding transcriptional LysR family regulator